jgi:hypothetical protein
MSYCEFLPQFVCCGESQSGVERRTQHLFACHHQHVQVQEYPQEWPQEWPQEYGDEGGPKNSEPGSKFSQNVRGALSAECTLSADEDLVNERMGTPSKPQPPRLRKRDREDKDEDYSPPSSAKKSKD